MKTITELFLMIVLCTSSVLVLNVSTTHVAWRDSNHVNNQEPVDVLRSFCQLDSNGVRLNGGRWSVPNSYVTWDVEPGWDSLTIVRGFRINPLGEDMQGKVSVLVEYEILGKLAGFEWVPVSTSDTTSAYSNSLESVEYQLTNTQSGWRIAKPVIQPHVSLSATLRHLRSLEALQGIRKDSKLHETIAALQKLNVAMNNAAIPPIIILSEISM